MFFNSRKKRRDRLEKASQWGILVIDQYLKSREKHKEKLTIFDGPGMDNNINLLCETIYLLGVFDAIVRYFDTNYKYLKPEDALGLLGAEFTTREELKGYNTWLEQAITQGSYSAGAYRIKESGIEQIDTLFIAGQLSFSKLKDNREEVVVPEFLGIETDYEFYDFSDFVALSERAKAEYEVQWRTKAELAKD